MRSVTTFFASIVILTTAGCNDVSNATSPLAPAPFLAQLNGNNGMTPFDLQFLDPALCASHGFAVDTHLTGNLKVASVSTRPSGVTRVVEVLPNGRITLSANGRQLAGKLAGSVHYILDDQGALVQIIYNGMNGVFTVPGKGQIAAETGRLIVDANGNVLWERGPHDVFGSSPSVGALCDALQP